MIEATEVFVFLIVALNSHWKNPVSYFLIHGLTAEEKANVLKTILSNIYDTGAIVKTLTFDGAASNISMAKYLGADLYKSLPWFPHPVTQEEICIFLDPAHMVKFIRNTLGDYGVLYDADDKPIEWKYFKDLVTLQEDEKIHLATKIRCRHINYYNYYYYTKEIMKVRLATQVFSNSVADTLLYCKTEQVVGFNNCGSTITFCRNINDIFDFLNTHNFLSKLKYKRPLYLKHEEDVQQFIRSSISYLESLKDRNHINIST